jgi:putative nucleotidyltransferase with HDIG domain
MAGVAPRAHPGPAFEALDHYPALAESRDRVVALLAEGRADAATQVASADVGLTITVLRAANAGADRGAGLFATVREGIGALGAQGLERVVRGVPTLAFFERGAVARPGPIAFSLHAASVQRVAATLPEAGGVEEKDQLLTAALLHDIGKLALAGPGPPPTASGGRAPRTPERRLAQERERFGIDHAAAGGELARRWHFPLSLVEAIELHHDDRASGVPALVRLADLLSHYREGRAVEPIILHQAALAVGLGRDALGTLMYELTYPVTQADTPSSPCPLTERELDVLRELAAGQVYKQVASTLGVSVSTVRNHAHHAYRKLGVADRTQAVVLASERGWL